MNITGRYHQKQRLEELVQSSQSEFVAVYGRRRTGKTFIDELPWLDTNTSDLNAALDWFWNQWASARKDIKLIVCGSAASWMIKTFINDDGGFYNRVTESMKIAPFNLAETKLYLESIY